ncbi:MAG: hypothetical protein IPL28_24770 [Chloroflexi bacterium]|nr:hypothetical protein [Chloroflexota bacterium]
MIWQDKHLKENLMVFKEEKVIFDNTDIETAKNRFLQDVGRIVGHYAVDLTEKKEKTLPLIQVSQHTDYQASVRLHFALYPILQWPQKRINRAVLFLCSKIHKRYRSTKSYSNLFEPYISRDFQFTWLNKLRIESNAIHEFRNNKAPYRLHYTPLDGYLIEFLQA